MTAYDRHVGSVSAGNVASSRRVNLADVEAGDWLALSDGRLLEVVERGWGLEPWRFLDVRRLAADDDAAAVVSLPPAEVARLMASVARRGPRTPDGG